MGSLVPVYEIVSEGYKINDPEGLTNNIVTYELLNSINNSFTNKPFSLFINNEILLQLRESITDRDQNQKIINQPSLRTVLLIWNDYINQMNNLLGE